MDVIERIKPLCYQDDDRPSIASPFCVEWNGRRWAAATDGHLLVMLPFDGELRTDGPDIPKLLDGEQKPDHAVSVSALRVWAGEPRRREEVCGRCNGVPPRRQHDGSRYCEVCDTLGKIVERWREGLLLHGAVNRILIAKVLTTLPEGIGEILIGQYGEHRPYIMSAEGWTAAVMPLRDAGKNYPRFEIGRAA